MQCRDKDHALERIGARIALDIGDGASDVKLVQFKYFLASLAAGELKPKGSIRQRIWVPVALSVLLGLSMMLWRVVLRNPEAPFWIGEPQHLGDTNTLLTAPSDGTLALHFPEKSEIVLGSGATAQMVESREKSVRLQLVSGDMTADIDKARKARWSIETGKFTVVVVGTKFTVSYDRSAAQLDVKVQRGKVCVLGAGTADDMIYVPDGTHLRVDGTGRMAQNNVHSADYDPSEMGLVRSSHNGGPSPANQALAVAIGSDVRIDDVRGPNASDEGEVSPAGMISDGSSKVHPEHSTRRAVGAGASFPGRKETGISEARGAGAAVEAIALRKRSKQWQRRMNNGEYDAVVQEADDDEMKTLIESAGEENLWQLMHAARKAGRDETAVEMLLACRERFPDTQKAYLAAFVLGTEYEKSGRLKEAFRWFDTYLDEDPNGELADDAHGRIMSLYQQQRDDERARETARRYLDEYPDGSFKKIARSILGR